MSGFGALNYAVLIVYFAAMLVVGIWAGRSTKGSAGYFTAEGKVHHVLVGLSLLGTYLSSLTMMALPRLSFGKADFTWTVQLPFLILTAIVITKIVLPRYRKEGCVSVYEFLERRLGLSARLLASVAFIVLSVARMGVVLYLPALAFHVVTGDVANLQYSRSELTATIVVMGGITAVYTILGGIKGVIWTDVIQVVVFVAGAVVSVFYMTVPDFFRIAEEHHKFRTFDWSLDFTSVATVWLVLETIFQTIRIYATQQEMTQRYLTAESTEKANRSVWLSILGYIPLGYLFYFIGVALFVFYQAHPDPNVETLKRKDLLDSLYAYFAVTQMPAGLSGLVIAAAAMSTIASSMNSCSAVCVEDFYKRFGATGKSDDHYLAVAKGLAVLWGVLSIAAALLCIEIESAQIVWSKIMGVSTCGVLGLMALAFLPRRIRPVAAVAGFGTAYVSLVLMMFYVQIKPEFAVYPMFTGTGVVFLLWPVVTNLVCFLVALGLNAALGGVKEQPAKVEVKEEVARP
jgi:SSS family solute:Na+ symporter